MENEKWVEWQAAMKNLLKNLDEQCFLAREIGAEYVEGLHKGLIRNLEPAPQVGNIPAPATKPAAVKK